MKKKIFSITLSVILAAQVLVSNGAASVSAEAEVSVQAVPLSVTEALPEDNLLNGGDFSDDAILSEWNAQKQILEIKRDANGGYLGLSGVQLNHTGFLYTPKTTVPAGTYKFTGYFRTMHPGELTHLRVYFNGEGGSSYFHVYPTSGNWTKVETVVTVYGNLKNIKFCGGPNANFVQSYCIDNISLVKTSEAAPEAVQSFGKAVTGDEALKSTAAPAIPATPTTPTTPVVPETPAVVPDANVTVAVPEAIPAGDVLGDGSFDEASALKNWKLGGQSMTFVKDENGGHLLTGNISLNYTGFTYTPSVSVPAGNYKFTGYFKTGAPGALTHLRINFIDAAATSVVHVYPTSDVWTKVETYITLGGKLTSIKVCGGPSVAFVQPYCMDNFSLVPVTTIPEGGKITEFGTKVSEVQATASYTPVETQYDMYDPSEGYEIQGIIINQDADGFIGGINASTTEQDLINYAKSFGGSHITDYMICVNNTNATFPSETWTDLLDKYHQTTENGVAVNYKNESMTKGAYNLYEVLKSDYIKLWCETFPEIGINPWLSFRMNDAHDLNLSVSKLLSDYFHENPQIRRVQHGSKLNTYYKNCQDYQYELVRDHMLDLINDALNRYDPYGIELDWQREIWLWHVGGEYEGIDILNQFMRDVEDLVAVYEEKYGHEIKISVRVASDIQTNYDFGLDVATWASEGIIDMVSPSGRWATTDNDMPIRLWTSILKPFGVELAPCIETNIVTGGTSSTGAHTLETFTGAAANFLSQGADKVYFFNYYRGLSGMIKESDHITTKDNSIGVNSAKGYWNVITTCGSYDKLMTMNRRVIMTYNDTAQIWQNSNKQLPKTVMPSKTAVLRLPIGDVPAGAEVAFKFSSSVDSIATAEKAPVVYINSKPATFSGVEYIGEYTDNVVLCYTVPVEAHDDTYLVAEIIPKDFITIDYCEAYVKAPEEAVEAPSDWAKPEVDAALTEKIVPASLQKKYTANINRQEFCTLIMAMINKANGVADSKMLLTKMGKTYNDSFNDTDNPDVVAANLIGIVNGRGEGVFDPTSGITRQEAAIMLANAAKVLGINAGTAPEFADIGNAASWAVDSIKVTSSIVSSTGKNVMGGVGDNRFDPLGAYTRQQSILTVYRLYMSR